MISLRKIKWLLRRVNVTVGKNALVLEVGSGGTPTHAQMFWLMPTKRHRKDIGIRWFMTALQCLLMGKTPL